MTDAVEAWNRRMREEKEFVTALTTRVTAEIQRKLVEGDPDDPHPFTGLADAGVRIPASAEPTEGIEAPAALPSDLQRAAQARQWREDAGMTLNALAAASGFSQSSIVDFERGRRSGRQLGGAWTIPEAAWRRYALMCLGLQAQQAGFKAPF